MPKRRGTRAPQEQPLPAAPPRARLWPAVIIVAGVIAYANSLAGVFTFDDIAGIVENESIRDLWPPTRPLSPPGDSEPVAGRPLVNLSFAINYAIDGLEVRGYHIVNVALHLGTALLLFGLVRRTLAVRSSEPQDEPASSRATHVAGGAALLWVVHPLTTEAVTYVSQRTELMMGFFLLLTLYASVRAAFEGGRWPVVAIGACALGMACKETMAITPLLVLLYDRVFLYRSFAESFRSRGRLYTGLMATWGLLLILIWSGPRWETAGFATGVSVWSYLLNQTVIITEYLQRVVWPVSLIHDYGEPVALTLAAVLPQALLVLALLVVTGIALVRRPAVGFLGAAFFIILAPTSSIIPIATEAGAERRMYLPVAALAVLLALGLDWLWRRTSPRLAASGLAATMVLLAVPLAAATIDRNSDYADELGLWQESLARWPNARAHRNLATLLKREGYRDEVIQQLRLALDGAHPEVRYGLGVELLEQGRTGEGINELQRFLQELPADPMALNAHQFLGDALLKERRFAAAAIEYERIVEARPTFAKAWSNLGLALSQSGNGARGLEAFRRAVMLDPRDAVARRNLVAWLFETEQPLEALPHAEAAVQLDPGDASGRLMFGVALAATGRLTEAADEFRRALERDPSLSEARELLTAVEQARRASTPR